MSMHEKQLNNDLFQPAVRSSDDAEKITKKVPPSGRTPDGDCLKTKEPLQG